MSGKIQKSLPLVAALGFLACGLGLLLDPKTALASYLVVWFAMSAIPIGALAVLLTSYLVKAGWTRDLYPLLARAALTVPAAALLFIPIAVGMRWIYPWASDASTLPAFKSVYLAPWFFLLRSVLYFVIWTAVAVWATLAYGNERAMTRVASAGLIVWSLTVSWAGIDWLESVEPDFHSSIYGLFAIDFDLLAGLSFGVVVLLISRPARQMSNAAYSGTLLSVLLLWAYMHAMQYIIIWTGNIPEEVIWYLKRLEAGWGVALWALILLQFVVPFFVLLSTRNRSSTTVLLTLAALTLVLRFLEAGVLVLPPLDISATALLLDLPAAVVAIGASLLATWQTVIPMWNRWSGHAAAISQHQ